jgi:hypothetical protein
LLRSIRATTFSSHHCEEQRDEAIQLTFRGVKAGLPRFVRNDVEADVCAAAQKKSAGGKSLRRIVIIA